MIAPAQSSAPFEAAPEPLLVKWLRRLAALTLYFTAGLVLIGLSPVLLPSAALIDLLTRSRWSRCRTFFFLLVYLCLEAAGVVISFGLWLRALALPRWYRPRFLADNFRLQCWWAGALRRSGFYLFNVKVQVEGEEQAIASPVLLFIRHCSVADTMLPTMLLCAPHGIVLRWVMKFELLWDPCVDIVGRRLQNCFVRRDANFHKEDLQRVATLAHDLKTGEGVAIYPEGTRFSQKKRERILSKLRDSANHEDYHRASALRSMLPPRLGGALALLEHNPNADALFCTHTGLEAATSLGSLIKGDLIDSTVRVALWRVPYADIPKSRDERIAWLWNQWQRADNFVNQRCET